MTTLFLLLLLLGSVSAYTPSWITTSAKELTRREIWSINPLEGPIITHAPSNRLYLACIYNKIFLEHNLAPLLEWKQEWARIMREEEAVAPVIDIQNVLVFAMNKH